MRVENCVGGDLAKAVRRLADLVASSDFDPDVVVGIERGGALVSLALQNIRAFDTQYCVVGATRGGTPQKSRLAAVVNRGPRSLLDKLRVVEHQWRLQRFDADHLPERHVTLSAEVAEVIGHAQRVLVVDDAVDTGATLKAVVATIHVNSNCEVRTAALTVTFPRPAVLPDFVVIQGVLLRFPWSSDFRVTS